MKTRYLVLKTNTHTENIIVWAEDRYEAFQKAKNGDGEKVGESKSSEFRDPVESPEIFLDGINTVISG